MGHENPHTHLTEPTRDELLAEIERLRQRVATLEAANEQSRHNEDRSVQTANEQTANILETISDAFVNLDIDWRYTYVNSQAEQFLGKPRSELLGNIAWDIFPEVINTRGYQLIHQAVAEQRSIAYEEFYAIFNKWFSVRLYPSAQGISVYFLDITDQKKTEEQIQCYADIVKSTQVGLVVWQLDDSDNPDSLRLLLANPAATQVTGTDFEALIGTTLSESFPSLVGSQLVRDYAEVIRTGRSKDIGEVHYGDERINGFFAIKAFPLPNQCIGLAFENITERKQIDKALQEALQQLTFHVENTPLGVVEWDRQYRVSRWSSQAEAIFGWTAEEIVGKQPDQWNFVHPDDLLQVQQAMIQLVSGQERQSTLQLRNFAKDGSVVHCEWYTSAMFNQAGTFESALCLVLNITKRKQIEADLQLANQRTLDILESITEGFSAFDDQWRYTYLNPQGEKILGVKRDEILGQRLWDIFPEATSLKFYTELGCAMYDKVAVHFEEYYSPLDTWFDCHAYPLDSGGICIYYQDITHHKRMEETLQISRERLDLVLRASELGVWFCDLPFDTLEWNTKCKEHFGLSPETEVTIERFYQCLHPDDREPTRQAIDNAIATRTSFDTIYRVVTPDGQLHWIRAIGSAFYDEFDQPIRFDGVTVDVTDQKRQDEERTRLLEREKAARQLAELNIRRIAQLQELTASLAETLSVDEVIDVLLHQGLDALNAQRGWIATRNADRAEVEIIATIGYTEDEISSYRRVPLSASAPVTDAVRLRRMVVVRSPSEYRERYPHMAESYIASGSAAVAAIPLTVEDRVIGALGLSFSRPQDFNRDDCSFMLTLARQCAQALERARLYEAERVARELAESANRIKDEFLAVLSHELRSPLNPILGWSKLLRSRKLDEQTTDRALETIERNAKLQTQLIEDLLDVSRILRGKLSLNITPVQLRHIIEAAIETVHLAAEAKSIQIQTVFDPDVGLVSGDPTRLQQVVWNLVSNAVKFTSSGGRVEVRLEKVMGNRSLVMNEKPEYLPITHYPLPITHYAQITVTDTGKGIHPDFLPYVFDYFRQADSTITRRFGGLGLGLAIVRHLVELHGGTVQAASPGEGLGASFTVRLPLFNEPTAHRSSHQSSSLSSTVAQPLQGISVLVVDDEADMHEFAAFVLEQAGATVITATSAPDALQLLIKHKPDLLLSDVGMPTVDGYALMRQVRQLPNAQARDIPAIALTAYAGDSNRREALSAGFQRHLPKPIEPEALIAAIVQLIGESIINRPMRESLE